MLSTNSYVAFLVQKLRTKGKRVMKNTSKTQH